MTGKLDGQIAIVTGSDSGIGQAIAREFAANGADVVITFFGDAPGAEDTRMSVEAAGRKALVLQLDVRDPAQIADLFVRTEAELGTPSILVNNAGTGGGGEVATMTWDEWDSVFKTNVYGPFMACQHFIKARRTVGGGGKIINVTSVHEEIPTAGGSAYCASKGALRNLTRCLALELADDGINVNNLAPGMVKTSMNQKAIDNPAVMDAQVQNIPLKRAAEPSEMARLALYLASADADYASGQTFTLDGGLSMTVGQGA
jgi:glucose 1-dehydrogenase